MQPHVASYENAVWPRTLATNLLNLHVETLGTVVGVPRFVVVQMMQLLDCPPPRMYGYSKFMDFGILFMSFVAVQAVSEYRGTGETVGAGCSLPTL